MSRKFLIAGNWKMHKLSGETANLAGEVSNYLRENSSENIEVLVCPTFINIGAARDAAKGSNLKVGAQNCHYETQGAFTGEVSPDMIKDVGCEYVIVGHSERRQIFGEKNDFINKKVHAGLAAGLKVILCVGETLGERTEGKTNEIIKSQLLGGLEALSPDTVDEIVIAYEPVWAIGTGVVAEPQQADEAHNYIRNLLIENFGIKAEDIPILYGGSMKPSNADSLLKLKNVNGGLIGGASLKSDDFIGIIKIAESNT